VVEQMKKVIPSFHFSLFQACVLAAMNLKTIQSTAVLLAIAEKCLSNE
jgi:hypothetical protein